jgi:hypothetical protein
VYWSYCCAAVAAQAKSPAPAAVAAHSTAPLSVAHVRWVQILGVGHGLRLRIVGLASAGGVGTVSAGRSPISVPSDRAGESFHQNVSAWFSQVCQ